MKTVMFEVKTSRKGLMEEWILQKKKRVNLKPGTVSHPLILSTQEIEIRMITVGALPGQKVSESPSQLMNQAWCHTAVIPDIHKAIDKRIVL
jgi:hypothetical protein